MIDNVLKEMRKTVLASCFGSTYDSLLMWSHYASKHKGFCLIFRSIDGCLYQNKNNKRTRK